MTSSNLPPTSPRTPNMPVPVDLLVSMATIPMLVGLVSTRLLTQAACQLGEMSEEMFRGDRLPLLKFPNYPSSSIDTGDSD